MAASGISRIFVWYLDRCSNRHRPVWVRVVSTASARKAARRGAKICPGFHPNKKVKEIYDAYRDEASKFGRPAGPDQLALRRQVAIALTEEVASRAISARRDQLRTILQDDPRVVGPGRQALDTPHPRMPSLLARTSS